MLMKRLSRFSGLVLRQKSLQPVQAFAFASNPNSLDADFDEEEKFEDMEEASNEGSRGGMGRGRRSQNQSSRNFVPVFTSPEERHKAYQALFTPQAVKNGSPDFDASSFDAARNLIGEIIQELNEPTNGTAFIALPKEQQRAFATNLLDLAMLCSEKMGEQATTAHFDNIINLIIMRLRNRHIKKLISEQMLSEQELPDDNAKIDLANGILRGLTRGYAFSGPIKRTLIEYATNALKATLPKISETGKLDSVGRKAVSLASQLAVSGADVSAIDESIHKFLQHDFRSNEGSLLHILAYYIRTTKVFDDSIKLSPENVDYVKKIVKDFLPLDESNKNINERDQTFSYVPRVTQTNDPLVAFACALVIKALDEKRYRNPSLINLIQVIEHRNLSSFAWKTRLLQLASDLDSSIRGPAVALQCVALSCSNVISQSPDAIDHVITIYEKLLNTYESSDNTPVDQLTPLLQSLSNFEPVLNPPREGGLLRKRRTIARDLADEEVEIIRRMAEMLTVRFINRHTYMSLDQIAQNINDMLFKIRTIHFNQLESTGIRSNYWQQLRRHGANLRPKTLDNFIAIEISFLRKSAIQIEDWNLLLDSLVGSANRSFRKLDSRLIKIGENIINVLDRNPSIDGSELRESVEQFLGKINR